MSRGPTVEVGASGGSDYATAFRAASRMADEGKSWSGNERNRCFLNTGQKRFADISAVAGLDFLDDGRAVAVSDWDADGDLDLLQVNRTAPQIRFLRNDWQHGNGWIALRLVGTHCNRDAVGARVEVYRKDVEGKDVRTVYAGCSFLSQSSKWIHFGLGEHHEIDRVVVRWPGGEPEVFTDVAAGQRYRLVQGTARAEVVPRRSQTIGLQPSDPTTPAPSERARVVLRAPVPLPEFTVKQLNGQPLKLDWKQPTLLQLWASWCPMCQAELHEFSQRAEDIRLTGMDVVALSVDGLGDDTSNPEHARQAIERWKFPFRVGFATEEFLGDLQTLRGELFSNRRPFPVPTSFLISGQGELVAIYLGPLQVEQLIQDVKLLRALPEIRRQWETDLVGRWSTLPREVSLTGLVSAFRDAGRDESAGWYQQKAAPQVALGYCGLAADAERRGDLKTALEFYQQALQLAPENARAQNYFGEYWMRRREFDKALASFEAAVRLDPTLAAPHHNLGTIYVLRRKFADAIHSYDEAIRLDPQFAKAYTALGRLLQQAGQHDKAAARFEAALSADPNSAAAHVYLGLSRFQQSRMNDAAKHFSMAVELQPDLPDAHEGLGLVLEAMGQTGQALRHLREAVRLNPASLSAAMNLAWLLATSPENQFRNGEEALQLAERVVRTTNMRSARAIDILAAAHAEAGHFEVAVRFCEDAAKLAETQADTELVQEINRRQQLYRRRQPYRPQPHSASR